MLSLCHMVCISAYSPSQSNYPSFQCPVAGRVWLVFSLLDKEPLELSQVGV